VVTTGADATGVETTGVVVRTGVAATVGVFVVVAATVGVVVAVGATVAVSDTTGDATGLTDSAGEITVVLLKVAVGDTVVVEARIVAVGGITTRSTTSGSSLPPDITKPISKQKPISKPKPTSLFKVFIRFLLY
jgi:phage tail sheath gpL-like